MGLSDQVGTIIPRGLPCRLGQDELSPHVDHGQPFQPMPPRQWLLGVVIHAPHKERADRALGKPGGVDGHHGSPSPPARHATHDFLEGVLQVGFVETSQEAVERGVVGNRSQSERSAQLSVFAQTNFGFPEGPVLVAHEAQDGLQLRLRESVFAKAGAIARHGAEPHPKPPARSAPNPLRPWAVASFASADCSVVWFRRCPREVELRKRAKFGLEEARQSDFVVVHLAIGRCGFNQTRSRRPDGESAD
jgi:hypothetical protein